MSNDEEKAKTPFGEGEVPLFARLVDRSVDNGTLWTVGAWSNYRQSFSISCPSGESEMNFNEIVDGQWELLK